MTTAGGPHVFRMKELAVTALLLFLYWLEVLGAFRWVGVRAPVALWFLIAVPAFLGLMAWKARTEISTEGIRLILWPERTEAVRWVEVTRVHYFEKQLVDERKRPTRLVPMLVLEGGSKPMELSVPVGDKAVAIGRYVSSDLFDEELRAKLVTTDERRWVGQGTWVQLKARSTAGLLGALFILASPWALLVFRSKLALGLCMGAALLAFVGAGPLSEPFWARKYQQQH